VEWGPADNWKSTVLDPVFLQDPLRHRAPKGGKGLIRIKYACRWIEMKIQRFLGRGGFRLGRGGKGRKRKKVQSAGCSREGGGQKFPGWGAKKIEKATSTACCITGLILLKGKRVSIRGLQEGGRSREWKGLPIPEIVAQKKTLARYIGTTKGRTKSRTGPYQHNHDNKHLHQQPF